MKYGLLLFLIVLFLLPVTSFAQQSLCFSADNFLVKTYYEISKKQPYGKNHMIFLSYKNSAERVALKGKVIYNNNKFAGIKYSNDNISLNIKSLNPKSIIVNNKKELPLKQIECFIFLSSYDVTLDSSGDIINILTAGKLYMQEKLKHSYSPYTDCSKAGLSIEKALCGNNEISFLDRMFLSSKECYKNKAVLLNKNDTDTLDNIDSIVSDFLIYRNSLYKSSDNVLSKQEIKNISRAYMLSIIFLPMTITANNGNVSVLGRNLFLSYYILSRQGIRYSGNYKTGLNHEDIVRSVYGDHYDEIMFYLSGVYDNLNSRLPALFYYTVNLQEKYGIIDSQGNYICK